MQITKDFIQQTMDAYTLIANRAGEVLATINKQHSIYGFEFIYFRGVDDTEVYFSGEDWDGDRHSYTFPTECLCDDSAIEAHVQGIRDRIAKANQAKVDAEAARQAKIKEDQYAEYLRLKTLFGEGF